MKYLILVILFIFISCGDTNTTVYTGSDDCIMVNMKEKDIKECVDYYYNDCKNSDDCYPPVYQQNIQNCYNLDDRYVCVKEEKKDE